MFKKLLFFSFLTLCFGSYAQQEQTNHSITYDELIWEMRRTWDTDYRKPNFWSDEYLTQEILNYVTHHATPQEFESIVDTLISYSTGEDILKLILQHKTEAANTVAHACAKQLLSLKDDNTLYTLYRRMSMLLQLIEAGIEVDSCTSIILQTNLTYLKGFLFNEPILNSIGKMHNQRFIQRFFNEYLYDYCDSYYHKCDFDVQQLFDQACENDPEFIERYIKRLDTIIPTIGSFYSCSLVLTAVNKHITDKHMNSWLALLHKHIPAILSNENGLDFLVMISQNHEKFNKNFIASIEKSFATLSIKEYSQEHCVLAFAKFLKNNNDNNQLKEAILSCIVKHFDLLAPQSFAVVAPYLINNEQLKNYLKEKSTNPELPVNEFIKILLYIHYCKDSYDILQNLIKYTSNPTKIHILHNPGCMNYSAVLESLTNTKLTILSENIINLQRQLDQQGYYTFVLVQKWNYHIIEQWYRWIWSLKHTIKTDDYIFAHVPKSKKSQKYRIETVINGRTSDKDVDNLLFMSNSLFAQRCCPIDYFLDNWSDNSNRLLDTLEKAFSLNNPLWKKVYEQYKQELSELEQEHNQLTKHGNVLLIAIPKDKIQKCVYYSSDEGHKKKMNIKDYGITDDIKLIMETLLHHPEKIAADNMGFSLVMTSDMALNPTSGIKFFDFNDVDSDKLEVFNKKEQALFEKVKQAIEKVEQTILQTK